MAIAVLNFISKYVPKADAAWLRAGKYGVKHIEYDWSLNERKTAPKPPRPDAGAKADA